MSAPQETLRLIGTCPVCEGRFKVFGGRGGALASMVHHGYKRPGDGMIHGDCWAVGREPYEHSCEATKEYQAALNGRRADVEGALEPYLRRAKLYFERTSPRYSVARVIDGHVETEAFAIGVTDAWRFREAYDRQIREKHAELATLEAEIQRTTRLINNWKLRSLEEVMEAVSAVAAQERQVQKELRAIAKDQKAAKAQALKAKREALAARRAQQLKAFADRVKAAAEEAPIDASKAFNLRLEFGRKKWHWADWRDLQCDAALLKLGIAKRSDAGYITYNH